MWRIARGLFLGDRFDANDKVLLTGSGITHILNCAFEIPCWYQSDFRYLHLRLTDPDEAFEERIDELCRFIHRGRKAGGVLVHCAVGVNRSASSIVAYLVWRGKTIDEALELLQKRVGESNEDFIVPNGTFLEQIEMYFDDVERDSGDSG